MQDTKSKAIILLDKKYFNELNQNKLLKELNNNLSWDKYIVLLIEFPTTDYSQIKVVHVA